MKKRFGDRGYFREPMKEWVSNYIIPKVAKKLDNTIYLFLAYMVLFLIGVFIWGLLFGFGYLFPKGNLNQMSSLIVNTH